MTTDSGIHITRTAFLQFDWKPELRDYIEVDFHPVRHLREVVAHIADDVTMGDIIRLVAGDPFLNMFFTSYSTCPVDEFAKALEWTTPSPRTGESLQYCYVYASCEMSLHKAGSVLPAAEINLSYDLVGAGPCDGKCGSYSRGGDIGEDVGCPEPQPHILTNWSISEMPLEELGPLPIRLVRDRSIFQYFNHAHEDPDQRYRVQMERRDLSNGMSLLDFLDAILYDISFSGGPQDRIEFMDGLKGMVADLESGKATTVPFELDDKETIQ